VSSINYRSMHNSKISVWCWAHLLVLCLIFVGCSNGGDTQPPVTPDTGPTGDATFDTMEPDLPAPPAPRIDHIIPANGLAGVATTVTLVGENFDEGIIVYLDGGQEIITAVSIATKTSLSFAMPKNPYGMTAYKIPIQIRLGASSSNFVEYQYTLVEDMTADKKGQLDTASSEGYRNFDSDPLLGRVYIKGLTNTTTGAAAGLLAEVGIAKAGTDPTNSSGFRWFPSTFVKDEGDYDVFSGTAKPTTSQDFDVAYRFSADGKTWIYADTKETDLKYAATDAGKLKAVDPPSNYCRVNKDCQNKQYNVTCKVDPQDDAKNQCVECLADADCAAYSSALGPSCTANNLCACATPEDCDTNINGKTCINGYCGCTGDEDCNAPAACFKVVVKGSELQLCQ
jgi:hypothetical protein